MIDPQWQDVHDLLIDIAEGATQQGDAVAGTYLQLLVRLHNLYPAVPLGMSSEPFHTEAMLDIHNVIVQTLSDLSSSEEIEHS